MTKFELIYNCVYKHDEQTICNSNIVRRAVNSHHAEDLIAIGASTQGVIAVASPLACPIQSNHEVSAYVEKMGYYLGGGADI